MSIALGSTAPPPQSVGFPGNASSARDAAIVTNQQSSNLLNKLVKTSSGGKRKKRGGNANTNTVVVPLIQPLYKDVAAPNQTAQAVTLNSVAQTNQLSLNNKLTGSSVSPAQPIPASQLKGGKKTKKRRRRHFGGTHIMGPNKTWGCYSGGKLQRKKSKLISRKMSKKNKITKKQIIKRKVKK